MFLQTYFESIFITLGLNEGFFNINLEMVQKFVVVQHFKAVFYCFLFPGVGLGLLAIISGIGISKKSQIYVSGTLLAMSFLIFLIDFMGFTTILVVLNTDKTGVLLRRMAETNIFHEFDSSFSQLRSEKNISLAKYGAIFDEKFGNASLSDIAQSQTDFIEVRCVKIIRVRGRC